MIDNVSKPSCRKS